MKKTEINIANDINIDEAPDMIVGSGKDSIETDKNSSKNKPVKVEKDSEKAETGNQDKKPEKKARKKPEEKPAEKPSKKPAKKPGIRK